MNSDIAIMDIPCRLRMLVLYYKICCVLLALVISGCSSIPVSTMIKFAGFQTRDLIDIPADDLRVKTQLDGGLGIDASSTNLTITLTDETGARQFSFALEKISDAWSFTQETWFSSSVKRHDSLFKLSPAGIIAYEALQAELSKGSKYEYSFRVSSTFEWAENEQDYEAVSQNAQFLTIWIKLSQDEPFIALIEEAELDLDWSPQD